MIVQELLAIQDRCGYLPADELRALAERLRVPLHRLHEVASFYPRYRLKPPPALDVKVCRDLACHLAGAASLRERLQTAGVAVGGVSCLGQCDAPVAVAINDRVCRGLTEEALQARIRAALAKEPFSEELADRSPTGWQIDVYNGQPRYEALRRFLQASDTDGLLQTLEIAGLRGMGGAGFPTARKWAAVRAAAADAKYVICNADESEPGTFKDRELLRRAPHLVIEGLAVAGLVTGATRGWIYLRHEYHNEQSALQEALDVAQRAGLLPLPLDIFVSPGGYIQGEESALLEALEDRRGEPRNKPPFPVAQGLFGKPTVINNVETLAWVPTILLRGGEWYRGQGVNGATGLRLVSVSGDVTQPGVYEVPFGLTVRELLARVGGVRQGKPLLAIAPSGPSSGFLPARLRFEQLPLAFVTLKKLPKGVDYDLLDLTLDFDSLGALGSMLGGAFFVVAEGRDLLDLARNAVAFFRNESCGKCVPCRLGSQQLVAITDAMKAGTFARANLPLVDELAQAMQQTSICGLGQVAANPLRTVLRYFPHVLDRLARG